ncbi:MAG: hypothetical protein IT290_02805 [Deltaproteobacteria bacterium]|nr:hypothetical protein [Deltaproteobacteria bacterium]
MPEPLAHVFAARNRAAEFTDTLRAILPLLDEVMQNDFQFDFDYGTERDQELFSKICELLSAPGEDEYEDEEPDDDAPGALEQIEAAAFGFSAIFLPTSAEDVRYIGKRLAFRIQFICCAIERAQPTRDESLAMQGAKIEIFLARMERLAVQLCNATSEDPASAEWLARFRRFAEMRYFPMLRDVFGGLSKRVRTEETVVH